MRRGMPLQEALRMAAADLHWLEDKYRSEVNFIGVDCDGNYRAASTVPGKTYIAMTGDMDTFGELKREFVAPPPGTPDAAWS